MRTNSINPAEIVPMDIFISDYPVVIDLVYADKDHPENIFGAIYRPEARLWLHKDLAIVTLLASKICRQKYPGLVFLLKDGMRTVEAQTLMVQSPSIQKHPHWITGSNRMISPPGRGAHSRGMAIDLVLADINGKQIDMGTNFDELSEKAGVNPAARDNTSISEEAIKNRKILDTCMMEAAGKTGVDLHPLSVEWWDFRMQSEYYNIFEPIWDADLPEQMRMTTTCTTPSALHDFTEDDFAHIKSEIESKINDLSRM